MRGGGVLTTHLNEDKSHIPLPSNARTLNLPPYTLLNYSIYYAQVTTAKERKLLLYFLKTFNTSCKVIGIEIK